MTLPKLWPGNNHFTKFQGSSRFSVTVGTPLSQRPRGIPPYLLCPLLQDKLRGRQADDGGLHDRPALHVGEGHGFDERGPGAGVPHAQAHFADAADGDGAQRRHVSVRLLPLVLQDDVARPAVARQRNLEGKIKLKTHF